VLWVDIACGLLACSALLFRRRARTAVALALAAAAAFVATAGVANMVALYGVARHGRLRVAIAIGAADVLAGYVFWLVYPGNSQVSLTVVVNLAIVTAVVASGALRQTQASLLLSYRERAERAEQEQRLRENQVRQAERTRIAREMHDVVTHRISLIALHAGGLMVDPELSRSAVKDAGELIYGSARQALDELRIALGALRADEPISLEQPSLDRIQDLVGEAVRAGQRVELDMDPALLERARTGVGRDAYRIVQEGLANARKHAPDATALVTLALEEGALRVRVENEVVERSLGVPGAGAGLIGLKERADLAGGTLRYGPSAGRFELVGELPWT
jgi:signal transduction histidine kinase